MSSSGWTACHLGVNNGELPYGRLAEYKADVAGLALRAFNYF